MLPNLVNCRSGRALGQFDKDFRSTYFSAATDPIAHDQPATN